MPLQRDPSQLPPMPDLGPVAVRPDPNDPNSTMVNIAGVVAIARDCESPQAERVYRTFCAAWDRLRLTPGDAKSKQQFALQEAMASVGKTLVLKRMP